MRRDAEQYAQATRQSCLAVSMSIDSRLEIMESIFYKQHVNQFLHTEARSVQTEILTVTEG